MKILDKLESLDCSQVARSNFRLPLILLALLLVSACSGGSEQSFEPDPSSDNLQADNLQTDTDSAVVDADMSQIAEEQNVQQPATETEQSEVVSNDALDQPASSESPETVDADPVNTPEFSIRDLALSSVVYTETEIELFWEKPAEDAAVVEYRIFRDGVNVENRDGLSFFDNAVNASTYYQYDVQGMDNQGQIVAAASIGVTTLDPYQTINEGNVLDVLDFVVSVANREKFQPFLAAVEAIENDGYSLADSFNGPEFNTTIYDCPLNGGSLTTTASHSLQDPSGSHVFDGCQTSTVNDALANGRAGWNWTLSRLVDNPGSTQTFSFDELSISDAGGAMTFLNLNFFEFDGTRDSRGWVSNPFSSESVENQYFEPVRGGAIFINDIDITRRHGPVADSALFQAGLSASFQAQSQETGNKPVSVVTTTNFEFSSENPAVGVLEISTDDDSWMRVSADNGDNSSFELILHTGDTTTTQTIPWSDNNRIRDFL